MEAIRAGEKDKPTGKGLAKTNLDLHTVDGFRAGLVAGMPEGKFATIVYKNWKTYTMSMEKHWRSALENKRYCEDGLHTKPHGNHSIRHKQTPAPSPS